MTDEKTKVSSELLEHEKRQHDKEERLSRQSLDVEQLQEEKEGEEKETTQLNTTPLQAIDVQQHSLLKEAIGKQHDSSDTPANVDPAKPTPTIAPSLEAQENEREQHKGEQEQKQLETPEHNDKTNKEARSKKRLTLQERLALAAKGKKKTLASSGKTLSNGSETLSGSELSSRNTSVDDLGVLSPEHLSNVSIPLDTKHEITKPEETIDLGLHKDELEKLKLENKRLLDEVNALKKSKQPKRERNELLTTIAQKDETIQQLMKEGEALSHKELKLNETIKKLKATNQMLEEDMGEFAKRHDESLVKLEELQDFLKTHKLKSIEQMITKYTETIEDLCKLKDENEVMKSSENKYKDLLLVHEETSLSKQELAKELGNLKIEHEMTKKQSELDLAAKEEQIHEMKQEALKVKKNYSEEINRLEEKIERLRLDREVKHDSNRETKGSEEEKVDFVDFKTLSDAHHLLQKQYLSSQENWKTMESNLLQKAESLKALLESAKKTKAKLSSDIMKANQTIQSQAREISSSHEKSQAHISRINELELSLKIKDSDLQDLVEKTEKMKSVYDQERANLNAKIQTLNEQVERAKELKRPEPLKFDSKINRDNSMSSNLSWNDIRLGESSTTPALNREYSVFMNNSHNVSLTSFTEMNDDLYDREQYSYLTPSHFGGGPGTPGISHSIVGGGIVGGAGGTNVGGTSESTHSFGIPSTQTTNNNLQLVNKMSSNIRRLEIELHTLKDECTKLLDEKEQREQELLESIKLNDEVNELKEKIAELEKTIQEKSIKEQTMLELIGEKSEQVEELKADVVDLKDLCRSQVQQMIELQGL